MTSVLTITAKHISHTWTKKWPADDAQCRSGQSLVVMEPTCPYVSIAFTNRNDGYGGELELRVAKFIDYYAHYVERWPGVVSPRARPSIIWLVVSQPCASTAPWNT